MTFLVNSRQTFKPLTKLNHHCKKHIKQYSFSSLSRIYNLLPGSHSKKIEALIPKLLELTDKLAMNISLHKYIESSVNTKRKAERPAEEGEDQNSDELKAASQGYKKVKVNNEDSIDIESSPIGATSTTKIVNKTPSGHSFSIKMICCKELDPYVPTHSRVKYPLVNAKGTEASLTLRREEFASLPKDAVLRLSKEHVTVTAKGLADNVSFQITDKSANGVYFMGNRIEGSYLQRVPERLKKEAPYNIRNGDIFGVLMNKDTQNKEMLLGFEFIEG